MARKTKKATARTKAEPTPGPWFVDGFHSIGADGYGAIAEMVGPEGEDGYYYSPSYNGGGTHSDVMAANSRLIAAAPDLLRIVTALEGWLDEAGALPEPSTLMHDSDEQTVADAIWRAMESVRGEK